jgi:hypothetical protein
MFTGIDPLLERDPVVEEINGVTDHARGLEIVVGRGPKRDVDLGLVTGADQGPGIAGGIQDPTHQKSSKDIQGLGRRHLRRVRLDQQIRKSREKERMFLLISRKKIKVYLQTFNGEIGCHIGFNHLS